MNTIAAGLGADVQNGIADPGRFAKENLIYAHQAEREGVNQRIQRIGIVEGDLAADSRHAERIAIMRDAGHHARQQRTIAPPIFRIVERTKAQAVQRRDRTRAHGEDVTQNPADPGGRALERFDKRRVIVRLDLESSAPAIAEINYSGILARGNDDALAGGRQTLQVNSRRLVRTMLGPHHGKDAQLDQVWFASKQFRDTREFCGSEIVRGDYFRSDLFHRGCNVRGSVRCASLWSSVSLWLTVIIHHRGHREHGATKRCLLLVLYLRIDNAP